MQFGFIKYFLEAKTNQAVIFALACLLLLIWQVPFFEFLHGKHVMPLYIHTFIELASVAVAIALFAVVWSKHNKLELSSLIILSGLLFSAGLMDLAHLLSYKGMPDFITPAGREKGINFWLAARFITALAFFIVAVRIDRPFVNRFAHRIVLIFSISITLLVYWLGLFHQDLWPRTFIEGEGLTPFKKASEYFFIAVLLISAVLLYKKGVAEKSKQALNLYAAASITVLSEFCFTIYYDVTDVFNLLGHIFKVFAFYFIFKEVLRKVPEDLSNFFSISPDMLLIADTDGNFRRINNTWEETLGYSSNEILSKNIFDFAHPEDAASARELVGALATKKAVTGFESRCLRKDGSYLWVEWSAASFGKLIYVVLRDITEQKRSEELLKSFNEKLAKQVKEEVEKRLQVEMEHTKTLEKMNEELQIKVEEETQKRHEKEKMILKQSKLVAINDVISALAHQWRQPLNTIGLLVQDMGSSYKYGEMNEEYLTEQIRKVMQHLEYMSKTIDNFAHFFRPQSEAKEFDCIEAVKKVQLLVGEQYNSLNIALEATYDQTKKLSVVGYETEFEYALLNIVSNSKDAILDKQAKDKDFIGRIEIRLARAGDNILITIEDNGGGIPEEIIENVFMPYFSTKSIAVGAGMGLYFTKMIIDEQMLGNIEAENTGNGLLVTIRLPIRAE